MNPATRGNEDNANAPVLYIALELSNKTGRVPKQAAHHIHRE